MSTKVREFLRSRSPATKRIARALRYLPHELADRTSGRVDPLRPPRRLHYVASGEFSKGERLPQLFADLGGLTPDEAVLDVGCGVGRVAVPLTGFLSERGSYEGLDIVPEAIAWCRRAITPRFPNFQFQVADIHNAKYNPGGKHSAMSYRFPFPDKSFDFAFLISVFTHMVRDEVENYVAEIARVLRPGGRCFATYFLLTEESERLMRANTAVLSFEHEGDGYFTSDRTTAETAIAFREQDALGMWRRAGLEIREPITYGHWPGRPTSAFYQDVVVAEKP